MTFDEYKKDIIKKMRALHVYKKEFEHVIDMLAKALMDYEKMNESFEKSGGQIIIKHTNKAGATNAAKNPFYLAIETLRQDILQYSRELGLTPAALKKINDEEMKTKKASVFSSLLKDLDT